MGIGKRHASFGQPIQVVSGNVLIFIVFGAVLMASGAGDLLMKIANRATGRFTGGAAHAAVASSALFGTLCPLWLQAGGAGARLWPG